METFNIFRKKLFTINELIIGFDFINANGNNKLFYYTKKTKNSYEWLFIYSKETKIVRYSKYEYALINTGMSFENFIKPLNLNYNEIK